MIFILTFPALIANDEEWVLGKMCGHFLATVFDGNLGKSVDTAKEECATACDVQDKCRFASLRWKPNKQTCILNKDCKKAWQDANYRLYVKQ